MEGKRRGEKRNDDVGNVQGRMREIENKVQKRARGKQEEQIENKRRG